MIAFGILVARAFDDFEEFLGIAIGDVEAEQAHRRLLPDLGELGEIGVGRADRIEGVRAVGTGEEFDELLDGIVLVQRRQRVKAAERARHRQRAGDVHIGRDQRKARPFRAGMQEAEGAMDVDLVARIERRALGTNEHVLEIQLDVVFDAHGQIQLAGQGADRAIRLPLVMAGPAGAAGEARRAVDARRMAAHDDPISGAGGDSQGPGGARAPAGLSSPAALKRAPRTTAQFGASKRKMNEDYRDVATYKRLPRKTIRNVQAADR